MWHRLSNLNTRYEPYNEQYINHGHRVYCCINYVLVFVLFTIILLPPHHIPYCYPALPIGPKIETGETWSIFNVLNWNWAGCSLEFNVQYDATVRFYGSTQCQSWKRAFVFEKSAWSSMIWIVLHSNFLFLYSLYRSADWIGMFTVTSATIPRNSLLLYCIFMP